MVLLGILKGTRIEDPGEGRSLSRCVGILDFLPVDGKSGRGWKVMALSSGRSRFQVDKEGVQSPVAAALYPSLT